MLESFMPNMPVQQKIVSILLVKDNQGSKACIAVANKNARIVWSLIARESRITDMLRSVAEKKFEQRNANAGRN